ncbi:GNAT family N-acetyltransferase [Dactylosporangium sucinum]|uniref:N-acetyltransferase n=1 Tax=Dactylosporangium sucinum TaxID=1424081 RepID=A0A917X6I1_9ACTN|nr:GNAT family N-acetyltransferase [Dactylosporangium sucinum]GGM80330.1 N-acetyltransferase [Dactylosporangium sucinum]
MIEVRECLTADAAAVAELAGELAQSFPFVPERFGESYAALLGDDAACLLLAVDGGDAVGYLLGFRHLTFYANGPVGWVEEILVRSDRRSSGVGRLLMDEFERWAARRGCVLVALATRRASAFYLALGYDESASYFRKVLPSQEP